LVGSIGSYHNAALIPHYRKMDDEALLENTETEIVNCFV